MNTCGIHSKRIKESLKSCSRYAEAENRCIMPVFVHTSYFTYSCLLISLPPCLKIASCLEQVTFSKICAMNSPSPLPLFYF